MSLALKGTTSNQKFLAMDIANAINPQAGGAVIGPWEVDQLSQEWIDAFMAVSRDLPKMQAGMRKTQKVKDEIVASHTTYKPIPKRH